MMQPFCAGPLLGSGIPVPNDGNEVESCREDEQRECPLAHRCRSKADSLFTARHIK